LLLINGCRMDVEALSHIHLSPEQLESIRRICPLFKVTELFLFGSVISDDFGSDSDIDFLVAFEPMDVLDYADNYFDFLEQLENITQRPVDLVIAKDLRNPVLIESINQTKALLYGKEDLEVEKLIETIE
jgi:uncharacterized protein